MVELEPVKQKMRKARIRSADEAMELGILTDNEAARMKQALEMVREVCKVDDFTLEELTTRGTADDTSASGGKTRKAA